MMKRKIDDDILFRFQTKKISAREPIEYSSYLQTLKIRDENIRSLIFETFLSYF